MTAIKILFFGLAISAGIAHADVSNACTHNCVNTSQIGNSLVFTLLDIHGNAVKVITTELPTGATLAHSRDANTKAQFTKTDNVPQIMGEGGPRSMQPGESFMDVISNSQYTTETHYVTIVVLGTYIFNNDGIIELIDVETKTIKRPRDKDREQQGK